MEMKGIFRFVDADNFDLCFVFGGPSDESQVRTMLLRLRLLLLLLLLLPPPPLLLQPLLLTAASSRIAEADGVRSGAGGGTRPGT